MRFVKLLHKWLSVIVALQILIWLGSGLFFNLMDHSKASGKENLVRVSQPKDIDHTRLLPVRFIINQHELISVESANPQKINSLRLIYLLDHPYYLLNHRKALYPHFDNEHSLIDAYSGKVKVIDSAMAKALAVASYSGKGQATSVVKIIAPMEDILKEENTSWRINFNDSINTSVYIDASSGRLVGHSNDDKRFADLFFKLHFMDYGLLGKSGSFNNGLIIFFSVLTLLLCLTGATWVVELVRKGRYRL